MSLINEMLTELDARQAQRPAALMDHAFVRATILPASQAGPRPLRRRTRVLLLLAGCAALTGGYLRWSDSSADPSTGALTDLAELEAPSAGVAEQSAAAPTPRALRSPAARTAPARKTADTQAEPARSTAPNAPRMAESLPANAPPLRVATAAMSLSETMPAAAAPQTPISPTTPHTSNATAAEAIDSAPASIDKKLVALTSAQRAALAYRQAMDLASTGHNSLAIDKTQEALRADPDHVGARQLAAALLVEKHRFEEAGTLLREGLSRKPGQPQLVVLLARLKAETGDDAGALSALTQTTQLGPDGHGLRAVILARQGRYGEALPSYEAALRLAPENAGWWLGLGVALEAEGQPTSARQALQRARTIGTLSPELRAFVDQKLMQ